MADSMLEALSQAGLVDPGEQKRARKRGTRHEQTSSKKLLRLSAIRGFDRHGIRLLERK